GGKLSRRSTVCIRKRRCGFRRRKRHRLQCKFIHFGSDLRYVRSAKPACYCAAMPLKKTKTQEVMIREPKQRFARQSNRYYFQKAPSLLCISEKIWTNRLCAVAST